MKKRILNYSILFLACFFTTSSFAIGSIDILGEGGLSIYNLDSASFSGGNAGVKLLFSSGLSPFEFVIGGGLRYERVTNSQSGRNYSYTSTITSYELGGDIGFKFMPIPQFTAYALASLYIAPETTYQNNITAYGVSGSVNPTVSSNGNIGVGLKGLYNITSNVGIGAAVYIARGVMSYGSSTFNGYYIPGDSGGYNIFNYNLVLAYYIN